MNVIPVPVPYLGTIAPRGIFQSNLGHKIHNKYWTKSEIKMHCVSRKALAILLDQGRQLESLVVTTKKVASRQVTATKVFSIASELSVDNSQLHHLCLVANKKDKEACLIVGEKEKEVAQDDYQSRFGYGSPNTTTIIGTSFNPSLHPFTTPTTIPIVQGVQNEAQCQ